MTKKDIIKKLISAVDEVEHLIHGKKFTMSIPMKKTDSDVLIMPALKDAISEIEILRTDLSLAKKSYVNLTFEKAEDGTICMYGEISNSTVIFGKGMNMFQGNVEQYEKWKKESPKKYEEFLKGEMTQ